jgi:hypothetical protein
VTKRDLKLAGWVIGFLILASGVLAQGAKFEPTKEEGLEVQLSLKDAQLAQYQLQEAQRVFQQKSADFGATVAKVKAAHKWPETVQYNMQTAQFEDTKKAEEKK